MSNIRNILGVIAAIMLLPFISACTDGDEIADMVGIPTYRMRLEVGFRTYDNAGTRATYAFKDGDQVHVLFQMANNNVAGTATYDAAADIWTLTPSQALAETDDGQCRLAFFVDAGNTGQDAVTLTQQTRIYTDSEATYQLIDNLLNVQGQLAPALGRIRFLGQAGQKCTVSGLSFASTFNLRNHTFALSPSKFTATCGADGYTPYYYCAFTDTDKPELTFVVTAESGLRRQFGAGVLAAGTSGYVSIPTTDSHEGWTLVNLDGGGEINFPAIATPVAANVRSTRVSLSASITSAGGGHINAAGFVISTKPLPTRNDSDIECAISTNISAAVTGLTPETTYHVRAYAVNEAGITYSEEITITTLSKSDDNSDIDYDDWGSDNNWNDSQGSSADVDHTT